MPQVVHVVELALEVATLAPPVALRVQVQLVAYPWTLGPWMELWLAWLVQLGERLLPRSRSVHGLSIYLSPSSKHRVALQSQTRASPKGEGNGMK